MPQITKSAKRWGPLAVVVLSLIWGAGCGNDDPPAAELPCLSSAGCDAESSWAGTLCLESLCAPCDVDEACATDPHYGFGATCVEGLCVACTPGDTECGCDGTRCADGLCVEGACVPCEDGVLGCACRGGTCDDGARCEEDRCVVCPAGEARCPCDEGDTCDGELACLDGRCVEPTCDVGDEGCPCGDESRCDEGLGCGGGLCWTCNPSLVGCACEDGACEGPLICDADDDACRLPRTCDDLECAEHQLCADPALDEAVEADEAYCDAACEPGYRWDDGAEACAQVPDLSCAPGGDESLLAICADQHRVCVEIPGGAECGECVEGYVWESGGCRALVNCEDLEPACSRARTVCVAATTTEDAHCGGCLDGFVAEGDRCEPTPNCAAETANSILERCLSEHRVCVAEHETASCGECEPGYTETLGTCVVASCTAGTLGDLTEACMELGRACEPDAGGATCGACLPGMEADGERCVAAADARCVMGSLLDTCTALGRPCVDTPEPQCGPCTPPLVERPGEQVCGEPVLCGPLGCEHLGRVCEGEPRATCGGCLSGWVPEDPDDPTSPCRERQTCADLGCPSDTYCVQPAEGDASCEAWPCPELDQAERSDTGECVACGVLCGDGEGGPLRGETGRVWPFTSDDRPSVCLCETQEGFYLDTSGAFVARACDEDGDGWVRESAESFIGADDKAVADNARCYPRQIDRFRLENDAGQRVDVLLCEEGYRRADLVDGCSVPAPVWLYESVRNDDPTDLARAGHTDVPSYSQGGLGRAPSAAELNPLTRGCVSETGDYNDNRVADIREAQEAPLGDGATVTDQVFNDFAYFVELHRGWFSPGERGEPGQWVIQERSRCDDSGTAVPFPLHYVATEGGYWRECTRQRDASFDRTEPTAGYDFAQWTCDDPDGSCHIGPAPVPAPEGEWTPVHGRCELLTPDYHWRGMNHASQFSCVAFPERPPRGSFNTCHIACDEDGCDGSSEPLPGGASSPVVRCEVAPTDGPERPPAGTVGFIAHPYTDGATRGCIDEWAEWPELCPGYDPAVAFATIGDGLDNDFGALTCGCGLNYGGLACSDGCDDTSLHLDPGYVITPRAGYWLCGDVTLSTTSTPTGSHGFELFGTSSAGDYTLDGGVSNSNVERRELCDSRGCDDGYRLY